MAFIAYLARAAVHLTVKEIWTLSCSCVSVGEIERPQSCMLCQHAHSFMVLVWPLWAFVFVTLTSPGPYIWPKPYLHRTACTVTDQHLGFDQKPWIFGNANFPIHECQSADLTMMKRKIS